MLLVRALLVCGLVVSVSACESWPPNEAEARKHFAERRESFDDIAEKMRGTSYWMVSRLGASSPAVEVSPSANSPFEERLVIRDDPEWLELLEAVGMVMVVQHDGAVSTDAGLGLWGWRDNQLGYSGFSHDPNMLDEFKLCQPAFAEVQCGRCAVALEDDWYLYYIWFPEYFSKEEWNAYLEGNIAAEEYLESNRRANRQCHIDGYTELGYDIEKFLDPEVE